MLKQGGLTIAVDITFVLILAATAADGLLAGASLDQSIKQLPARHRIGVASSEYSRASDLGPGVLWYGILGVGAAVLTIAAAILALASAAASALIMEGKGSARRTELETAPA
ncbi:MAG TPA: hypothetical protein VFE09_05780 [Rubrobacteraceae bacterium]|nr:hypothetical protein [Rubrobacteraceae bacterium]